MVKLIEMVCIGNSGRSPVMRLLGIKRLQELGQTGYSVDSSGISVKMLEEFSFPQKEMIWCVNHALTRGVYSPEEETVVRTILESGQGDLTSYFKKAVPAIVREEHAYRARVLGELGLNVADIQPAQQTIPRGEVAAIITADVPIAARVAEIYRGSAYTPIIASASELAGLPEITSLAGNFDWGSYSTVIRELTERTPKAIDEILGRIK